ncbi:MULTISPECIES: MFS transporter [Bradyrhizobium]|jgi:predicted MFS family arabinose efflux permease|uniref:MFS transporter n=1 Tax=Bradyrhizobium denitrificans TaxID=2734912 RepID=A0ABS5G1K9_9BRAD|nr:MULTISPECIES: MFS transporter [Bradyrhizobium]MBR1135183.1 MFS transporter [Bradyrhizobium denitrificans]MDU0954256.1 MFS transporter [Bradyrhizobium sp.]MDU1497487.1 MFS transporter [Bradyrhizobium sp.]MDU1547706.1 MFS transporter [Bradyrhizobium sp.]MDU1665460.1 MFS transporter [Bradyrhizobium sp.]
MVEGLLVAGYMLVIGNVTIMPMLLPYVRQDVTMSDADAALILACFSLVAIPANLVAGVLSDRYERGMFLTVGSSVCSLSFVAMATVDSAIGIILARAVCAIGMAMVASAIFPSVGDRFAVDQRARVTALILGGSSAAPLLWQPLCTLFGGIGHWRLFVLIMAVFAVAVALAARSYLTAIREPATGRGDGLVKQFRHLRDTAIHQPVGRTLVSYCFCAMATSLFMAMYPSWLHDQGTSSTQAAIVFVFGGLGSVLSAAALNRGAAKDASIVVLGAWMAAVMAFSIIAMKWFGAALILQAALFMLFFAARSTFLAVTVSSLMTLVGPSQRGAINGLLSVTFQTAVATGSGVAVFAYRSDPTLGTIAAGALVLLGLAAVSAIHRTKSALGEVADDPMR